MTRSSSAVFLSYASEDAAAAQRICSALRAAGIEVLQRAYGRLFPAGVEARRHRSLLIANDAAFLVPIVIDDTNEE